MSACKMTSLMLLALLVGGVAAKKRENPVTRVVGLMEKLIDKCEADGKEEEGLWDKYVCWYKTVVSEKQASNEEAKDRLSSLNGYIDDINSGRVEFSTEKKDLTEQVAKLNEEISQADVLRKQSHDDYEAAKEEMDNSIAALEQAVSVLGGDDSTALATLDTSIHRAVELGKRNLDEKDAHLLEKALDGAAPAADWKKLNKGALNKEYQGKSGKITDMLTEMLATFQDNLADATSQDSEGATTHTALMASKRSQLSAAQDALAAEEAEGGLKGLNVEEANQQVQALETQVQDDEGYIQEAHDAYAVKSTEWAERKRLRVGEIAAISKAIEVLRSDDARDTLSQSFKSQGAALLQEASDEQGCMVMRRKAKAVKGLQDAAKKRNDSRLSFLALQVQFSTGVNFDSVVAGIDKIISDLNAEAAEDFQTKDDCQDQRMNNTRVAKINAQAMDDQTALIARKQADMNDKQRNVESIVAQLRELNLNMEEAVVMRAKEKADYEMSKGNDEAAITLIGQSKKVLSDFYDSEGLALTQTAKVEQAPTVEAGAAPPPPPATFSQPYGGAKGESNGIISILEMLVGDIQKDITTATAMEEKGISDYQALNSYTLNMISTLNAEKADLDVEIGADKEEQSEAVATRDAKKDVLDNTLGVLKAMAPGCDFMVANFELRKANRNSEIDGLYESKGALMGGSFTGLLQKGSC